jgi:hypothetical protein
VVLGRLPTRAGQAVRDHRVALRASLDQLAGLPEAFVIVDENDVLRDEGEAYARKPPLETAAWRSGHPSDSGPTAGQRVWDSLGSPVSIGAMGASADVLGGDPAPSA